MEDLKKKNYAIRTDGDGRSNECRPDDLDQTTNEEWGGTRCWLLGRRHHSTNGIMRHLIIYFFSYHHFTLVQYAKKRCTAKLGKPTIRPHAFNGVRPNRCYNPLLTDINNTPEFTYQLSHIKEKSSLRMCAFGQWAVEKYKEYGILRVWHTFSNCWPNFVKTDRSIDCEIIVTSGSNWILHTCMYVCAKRKLVDRECDVCELCMCNNVMNLALAFSYTFVGSSTR